MVAQAIKSTCKDPPTGLIPRLGRSPGEGNANPLQYSCLGNSMDSGVWWATVHRVTRVRHVSVTTPPPVFCISVAFLSPRHICWGSPGTFAAAGGSLMVAEPWRKQPCLTPHQKGLIEEESRHNSQLWVICVLDSPESFQKYSYSGPDPEN